MSAKLTLFQMGGNITFPFPLRTKLVLISFVSVKLSRWNFGSEQNLISNLYTMFGSLSFLNQ